LFLNKAFLYIKFLFTINLVALRLFCGEVEITVPTVKDLGDNVANDNK